VSPARCHICCFTRQSARLVLKRAREFPSRNALLPFNRDSAIRFSERQQEERGESPRFRLEARRNSWPWSERAKCVFPAGATGPGIGEAGRKSGTSRLQRGHPWKQASMGRQRTPGGTVVMKDQRALEQWLTPKRTRLGAGHLDP